MIIVTGATGQLGRRIVDQLLARLPAEGIGVSVRDPAKAAAVVGRGVRVRRGDFADPASLPHAFEGASQVLIVSSNARASGGDPIAQHRAAIDAAVGAGARRIVYTSHMAASATSAFPPMHDHASTEAMLAGCGVAWTALRHGFYAASGVALLGDALETGVVEAPVDGKVSWTAHDDLAEAAAIVLADEGRFSGPTPSLTGSEALDLDDLCRLATPPCRTPIVRRTIDDEAFIAGRAARGVPAAAIEIAVGLYRAARNGEFAAVDPTLERLLGRRPKAMAEIMARLRTN